MIDYTYYNGVFCPYDAAAIPLSDRSIFFGDAVYDVVLGRGGIPYQLDEHLERIFENAKRIGYTDIPTKSELEDIIDTLLAESEAVDFLIYLQLSGSGRRRNHARSGSSANLLVTVTECTPPSKLDTVRAITLPDNRHGLCDIKTNCLLPSVLSIEEAYRRSADIAIFHNDGAVTECSHANICICKGGTVIAHPFDSSILPGITQKNLELACNKMAIPFLHRKFSLQDLFEADLVIITSTTTLVKICSEIDGKMLNTTDPRLASTLFDALKKDLFDKTNRKVTK